MFNTDKLEKHQEFHSINANSISQLKQILNTFRSKVTDIAFLSNESISKLYGIDGDIDIDSEIVTKIKQHDELEILYNHYKTEYHQKKQKTLYGGFIDESVDSEEIESLKQNLKLYKDSVIDHTLNIIESMERDRNIQRLIRNQIGDENFNKNSENKWIEIIDSMNVFESIMSNYFSYNWKYHQLENKKLHKLKTMVAKEKRTLNFLITKQKNERNDRKYRLQTLYDRISSLQNKIIKIKNDTENKRDEQQKYHQNWIDKNVENWTKQRQDIDEKNQSLKNGLHEVRENDKLKESKQLRRVNVKEIELLKLQSEYTLSIKKKYDEYSNLKRQYEQSQDKLLLVQDAYKNIQDIQAKEALILHNKKLRGLWYCGAILKIKLFRARKKLQSKQKGKAKKGKKGGKKGKKGGKKGKGKSKKSKGTAKTKKKKKK